MKPPAESYFPSVTLFADIPVIAFPSSLPSTERIPKEKATFGSMIGGFLSTVASVAIQGNRLPVNEQFLKALGIRDHLDLQMVFDRLDTLNWDHIQLSKYLASLSDKMTVQEIENLKRTPLFPRERAEGVELNADAPTLRHKASELYMPSEHFRGMDVPILDWKGKWYRHSAEATFLIDVLGLKPTIPLTELLGLAADTTVLEVHRTKYLKYLLENWSGYESKYRAETVPACLPIEFSIALSKPVDCYSESSGRVLGFQILRQDFKEHASKLGVDSHPSSLRLLKILESCPPGIDDAVAYFDYFAQRSSGLFFLISTLPEFSVSEWKFLSSLNFIPISKTSQIQWMAPIQVFFNSDDKTFAGFFDFVDFGTLANTFLRNCGVKDQPSTVELATMMVKDPENFCNSMGFESYLATLRQLAAQYTTLSKNSTLRALMKDSPFLVGVINETSVRQDENRSGMEIEESHTVHYKLACAKDIYLIDDSILYHIFTPLGCPLEAFLETMYHDLGSAWLSTQVTEVYSPQGDSRPTDKALKLQSLIHDRADLILYDGIVARSSKELLPLAANILKDLSLWEVPHIEIRREFGKRTNIQLTGACILHEKTSKRILLFIAGEYDYFDVASALCKLAFRNPRLNDRLLVSTLLSTSLSNLKSKGFPVERILSLQKNKLLQAEKSKAIAAHNKKTDKQTIANNVLPQAPISAFDQLKALFPDIDNDYLKGLVDLEKGSIAEVVAKLCNQLLDSDYPSAPLPSNLTLPLPANPTQHSPANPALPIPANPTQHSPKKPILHPKDSSGLINKMAESFKRGLGMKAASQISQSNQRREDEPSQKGEPDQAELTPDYTKNLESHLKRSLGSLITANEKSFAANILPEPPAIPQSQAQSRCRMLSDADLRYLRDISGIRFFVDKRASQEDLAKIESNDGLTAFAQVLITLARVFGVTHTVLHIYWDVQGSTVAFNRGRTIFFNLRFYLGLHHKETVGSIMPGSFGAPLTRGYEVYVYWFMTMCHELGHNFVGFEARLIISSDHNAEHEFYMSSFAETYIPKLVIVLNSKGIGFA